MDFAPEGGRNGGWSKIQVSGDGKRGRRSEGFDGGNGGCGW